MDELVFISSNGIVFLYNSPPKIDVPEGTLGFLGHNIKYSSLGPHFYIFVNGNTMISYINDHDIKEIWILNS